MRSNTAGRVVGHFTLYNIIAWQVVLAQQGGHSDTRIGLISNAPEPAVWSDRIADDIDIDFAWLNAPDDAESFARLRARIGTMIERHQQQAMHDPLMDIVDSVFEKHGLAGLSAEIDERINQCVIAEISQRAARHFLSVPHEQPLGPAEIEALVLKGKMNPRAT